MVGRRQRQMVIRESISNVGADGFYLAFDKFGGGARVMYLAFQ